MGQERAGEDAGPQAQTVTTAPTDSLSVLESDTAGAKHSVCGPY